MWPPCALQVTRPAPARSGKTQGVAPFLQLGWAPPFSKTHGPTCHIRARGKGPESEAAKDTADQTGEKNSSEEHDFAVFVNVILERDAEQMLGCIYVHRDELLRPGGCWGLKNMLFWQAQAWRVWSPRKEDNGSFPLAWLFYAEDAVVESCARPKLPP